MSFIYEKNSSKAVSHRALLLLSLCLIVGLFACNAAEETMPKGKTQSQKLKDKNKAQAATIARLEQELETFKAQIKELENTNDKYVSGHFEFDIHPDLPQGYYEIEIHPDLPKYRFHLFIEHNTGSIFNIAVTRENDYKYFQMFSDEEK